MSDTLEEELNKELIECDMIHGTTKRLSPDSTAEAYCYQIHDNLQLLYALSLIKERRTDDMVNQINLIRLHLAMMETNLRKGDL